jgi:hypothetical protein
MRWGGVLAGVFVIVLRVRRVPLAKARWEAGEALAAAPARLAHSMAILLGASATPTPLAPLRFRHRRGSPDALPRKNAV